jgi:hypothetical protein
MSVRLVSAAMLVVALAPFQCRREPDQAMRREDTPGDALWDLSEDFRAKGNAQAADATLKFLIDKYPSSRYAPAAREKLGGGREVRDGG